MKVQFSCSSCGAKYQAAAQLAGQKSKCKHCGAGIEVPKILHEHSLSAEQTTQKSSDTQSKPNRAKRILGKAIKVAALSVFIIAILALGVKYAETILKVEAEASGMTYSELFSLCDKSIDDRTNLIIELRGLYPDIDYKLKGELIEFLNHENELTRAKRAFYRHQLTMSSSMERLQEHVSDSPTSDYGWDYYYKRTTSLKTKLIEAITEIVSSADNFKSNYVKLVEQESTLSTSMSTEGIRFPTIFKQYKESNIKLVEESKATAEIIKKKLI